MNSILKGGERMAITRVLRVERCEVVDVAAGRDEAEI
jgi:hypothetical protein